MKNNSDLPAIIRDDPYLNPYIEQIKSRTERFRSTKELLTSTSEGFGHAHRYYGLHEEKGSVVIREWAPNASEIFLLADISQWSPSIEYSFRRLNPHGDWEISIPEGILNHGDLYRLLIRWPGGEGERIPAFCRRVYQDPENWVFSAQIWLPKKDYKWKNRVPFKNPRDISDSSPLIIYEAHVGMATEKEGIGSYDDFRKDIIPRIAGAGFNAVQFMALMEHPYYGSFGYQVSSFFALSSRYGTPEEFKALVDDCHKAGLKVIMDLVHSHAVKNEVEGISRQDGTRHLYFHYGPKGDHPGWDSRCFNYGNNDTLNFLLSNCAFWLEEYCIDGFRFDGVTSMLYHDHGLGASFDHYDKYFNSNVDEDAVTYLTLANYLIHSIRPDAVTIAEDMSGLPGIARTPEEGGCGFDFRLAMGIPDYWIKIIKHKRDEEWSISEIWETLNNRRFSEKHIAYSESHDQALVGDKTIIFRLIDAAMYTDMSRESESLPVSRGTAIWKLINLLTFSLGGDGFMNFMGNEFGHPEWIDFPREGNGWSYHYARRQWSLADNTELKYSLLLDFTRKMIAACSVSLKAAFSELLFVHEDDGVIFYRRGDNYYVVNINPFRSFTDYGLPVPAGKYHVILNTDSSDFDGFGRTPDDLLLEATTGVDGINRITPYLPSRTGLVFMRQEKSK